MAFHPNCYKDVINMQICKTTVGYVILFTVIFPIFRIVFDDAASVAIKREPVFEEEALQDELAVAAKNIKLEPVSVEK